MHKVAISALAAACLALLFSCHPQPHNVRPPAAAEALGWLEAAVDTTEDGAVLVRERYDLQERRWISLYRPDCNVETAYAFLRAWEQTGDNPCLELARAIYRSIATFQNPDGSFPFADRKDRHVYTNDNSEVPIFLMRMARLDAGYAPRYLDTALKGADFLVGIQNDDGSWRVVDNDDSRNAMFTAHAVAALSMAAAAFPDRAEYERAVENGIAFIRTQVLPSGRVRTCCEVHPGTEYWRPPSSDQAITVRGIAMAEYYLPDNPHVDGWKDLRRTLLGWLDLLVDGSGALRNGLGEGINGADLPDLTDNVYTTAFGMEAYLWSWLVDGDTSYRKTLEGLAAFCAGNLFHSDDPCADGVWRGAYNLRDRNWDTSSLVLNSGKEGGSAMIYSGWANAPIAAMLIHLESNGPAAP